MLEGETLRYDDDYDDFPSHNIINITHSTHSQSLTYTLTYIVLQLLFMGLCGVWLVVLLALRFTSSQYRIAFALRLRVWLDWIWIALHLHGLT